MSTDDEPHILDNSYIRVAIGLLYTSIFVLCFFGNLAVVVVVSLHRKRRSASKFCLGNMAVVNLAVSIFCIFQTLTVHLLDDWIFGDVMCKIYHFVTSLCHAASVLNLVAISIERYLVILHPLTCRQILTTQTIVLVVLSVWLASAGISLPALFFFRVIRTELNENGDFGYICAPNTSMYNSASADMINFFLLYVVPLVVVLALYLRIGLFLRQNERLRRELSGDENTGIHVGKRQIQDVPSSPEVIGFGSPWPRKPCSNTRFTFRCSQKFRRQLLHLSMKGTWKWNDHPKHLSRFVSTIESRTRSDGKEESYDESNEKPTGGCIEGNNNITTSSIFQQRTSIALKAKDPRILYRYSGQQVTYTQCKQRENVFRMFIFIFLTFAVLNLPYHARKLCLNYYPSLYMASDANYFIGPLSFALMYVNCAVNPLVYVFMSKYIRACFKGFCHRRCCSKSGRKDKV